jgi:hypothetical protein
VRAPAFLFNQSSLHWVSVHVSQFLYTLVFVVEVEIVVACLPERPFPALHRDGQLECLDRLGEQRFLRLVNQHVNMFRHQDIADYKELITDTHDFEGPLEEIASWHRARVG